MRQLLLTIFGLLFLLTSCSKEEFELDTYPETDEMTEQSVELRWAVWEINDFQNLWEFVDENAEERRITTYSGTGEPTGWRYLLKNIRVNGIEEPVAELAYDASSGVRLEIRTYDDLDRLERIIIIGDDFNYESTKHSSESLEISANIPGTTLTWEDAPIFTHWCFDYEDASPNCEDEIGEISSIIIQI